MATMRAVQVAEPGGEFELVEREVPSPGRGEALVRVNACGVCHSDSMAKEGTFPGVTYPIIPGHEIAGVIEELGEDVHPWEVGQRVGVGWYGGNCGWCEACRRGVFVHCVNMKVPGVQADGGYAEFVVVKSGALAAMPPDLDDAEAAPLLCAGITTFNALRQTGVSGGDLVAILGVGGLGHLGVQFANKLGCEVVAIARGTEKEALARELGAHHYLDSTATDPAEELQKLGGAKVILSTVTSAAAMSAVFGGLGLRGQMILVGASVEPMEVVPAMMIGGDLTVSGHASGSSIDSEDTLKFSALSGVRARIETVPLERAAEAYERMMAGQARFRMVLTT
jgi:D-arabinose 1-dehydrogenase-like Zn-dependent alcohol dehydrogenase